MSAYRVAWLSERDTPDAFPDVRRALVEPNGLLAAGGDLSSARLLHAYRHGIFPWYEDGQPVLWWSPDPRCVLLPAELRVSRRLRQYARRSTLVLTFNRQFAAVMRACAGERSYTAGTWITPSMLAAYERLHSEGWGHSVEIWDEQRLVGGLYGLCIGKVFFGESMFSTVDNASKFALLGLVTQMLENGLELLDGQVASPHLLSLGASLLDRERFSAQLQSLCDPATKYRAFPADAQPIAETLAAWQDAALQ